MWNMKSSPPVEPLVRLVARLERSGIACALGGSGLLAWLGLADQVRDWDLTTDASLAEVIAVVRDLPHAHSGHIDVHVDDKLMFESGEIELIVRFALQAPGGVVHIPTIVAARANEVPLGSPEAWAIAYALMERRAKAERLFEHLRERGANRAAIERLLAQPLPDDLRVSLRALPAS
jgi:hypothetical protein